MLRWFGHAARHPDGDLIKGLLLPTLPRTWRNLTGDRLKTWATTIKAALEHLYGLRVFGSARWRKDWANVSSLGRGLWTWPPWVICAPAFNYRLKKFCTYRGFSVIVFLRKLHKRTEEIRIGQWKGYYMEHWGSRTSQPANTFKMAERWMKFHETQ